MRFLDDAKIDTLLEYERLIPALEEMHRAPPAALDDLLLEQPAANDLTDRWLIRPAWQKGEALGIKLATIFPNNLSDDSGLPSVQAVYILFDGEHGTPEVVMDATVLTWRKTAGDSALGAKQLARYDAKNMVMVGAGAMAPELIKAHLSVRPSLTHVLIWNRTEARAVDLAERLHETFPEKTIAATNDLEMAVRDADLVSCATMTETPVLKGAWLKPGAHVDLVGAFTPAMREADDEALQRASIFVDSFDTAVHDTGELGQPLAAGTIRESDILASHFDLAQGKHPGRQNDDEITLMKNGGGGHLDLMTARHALDRLGEEEGS